MTILLIGKADEIPFDLRDYPHIVYERRLADLNNDLQRKVRWHLENPGKVEVRASLISAQINDVVLTDNPVVSVPITGKQLGFRAFSIIM